VNRYTARWVAWSVGVLSIALLVAALILFLVDRSRVRLPEDVGTWSLLTGLDIAVSIPVPILGALIASRRPRNAIGWVYLGHIFLFALVAFGQMYAVHSLLVDPGVLPGGRFMAWLSASLFPIGDLPVAVAVPSVPQRTPALEQVAPGGVADWPCAHVSYRRLHHPRDEDLVRSVRGF
jgi:hypothetical protein